MNAIPRLREMLGRRLESDVVSHDASISACEKGLQWMQALALLREMLGCQRLESDFVSYSAGISACEKGLLWVPALALLREMPERWL